MLADILSRYKSGLSLLFTILFSLTCLIWQSNILARGLNQAVEVLDFFTSTFHTISSGFTRLVDSYGTYENLKNERDAFREQLKVSQDIKFKVFQLESENANLRRLLGLPQIKEFPVVQAQVVSQDPDNWFRTIIINKGSNHGVEPYMPVIAYQVVETKKEKKKEKKSKKKKDEEPIEDLRDQGIVHGIVGKVIQVNSNSARVLPITDQYSRLGILLKRTGHWAMLTGQNPYADLPKIDYLSLSVYVQAGDEIITSGGDGIFPRGLLVGYVDKKIERLGGFQKAELKPALDLKKLEFVSIIMKRPDFSRKDFPPLSKKLLEQGEIAIRNKQKRDKDAPKKIEPQAQKKQNQPETKTEVKPEKPKKKKKKKTKRKDETDTSEEDEILGLDDE